jgi:uncharacterized membrane protein YfhO
VIDKNQIINTNIISYTPNRVIIAKNEGEGTLVLSDTYYPGWKATIDGVEEKVLRVNNIFRAVEVPKGKHIVVFDYKPKSFTWGLIITIISSITTFIAFIWMRKYSK